MKQALFLITILLLCVAFVNANEYKFTGQDDGTYVNGNFNQALTDYDTHSQAFTSPSLSPLVADLNGDGQNEIIAIDGQSVRIFHGSELTVVDSVLMNYYDASFRPTTMVVADLNDDGFKEIVIPSQTASGNISVNMLNYDGTILRNQYNLTQSTATFAGGGEMQIGCDDVANRCLLVYAQIDTSAVFPTTRQWTARFINTTTFGTALTETASANSAGTSHNFCAPHIPVVAVNDLNNNGVTDFTITMLHVNSNGANTDPVRIVSYEATTGLTGTIIMSVNDTSSTDVVNAGASFSCRTAVLGNYFTSPLVHNFDGALGNGLEIAFASEHNANSFGIYAYGSTGTFIDDYPELTFEDGTLVGNLFRADAFDTSGSRNQFCAGAFVTNSTINETHVLCANIGAIACGSTFDNIDYNVQTPYNISSAKDFPFSTLVGASQQDHVPYDGINNDAGDFDEVVTSFGVYRLATPIACFGELTPIWNNFNLSSQHQGSVIAVDVENVSLSDLLMLSPTNLYYFDDGFTNSPATITNFDSDPCLNSTWQQNTTVQIGLTADDINADPVSCRAFLYYNTPQEQLVNWTAFLTHGTTFTFNFIANTTVGSGVIRGECRDDHNLASIDSVEYSFSVSTSGRNFGDCQTHIGLTEPVGGNQTNTSLFPSSGNIITNLLAPLNVSTGLGMTVLWLIIMVLVAIGGFVALMNAGATHVIAGVIIAFAEVLLLIIGIFLGFIGLGVLFAIVIIMTGVVVMILRKMLFGSG